MTSSAGYWGYLKTRKEKRDNADNNITKLLMGMASIEIIQHGMDYIERGWITKDEYDDLRRYLYEPYRALGGNGTVDRIMYAVQRLDLKANKLIVSSAITAWRDIPIREEDEPNQISHGGKTRLDSKTSFQGEDRRGKTKWTEEDDW